MLPAAALLAAASQIWHDVSRLSLHPRCLFPFVTAAPPAETMGRVPTSECTYLPTPDETGTYQRLGTATAMGCANHKFSEELIDRFNPPRAVSWRMTCLVLQHPLP